MKVYVRRFLAHIWAITWIPVKASARAAAEATVGIPVKASTMCAAVEVAANLHAETSTRASATGDAVIPVRASTMGAAEAEVSHKGH